MFAMVAVVVVVDADAAVAVAFVAAGAGAMLPPGAVGVVAAGVVGGCVNCGVIGFVSSVCFDMTTVVVFCILSCS